MDKAPRVFLSHASDDKDRFVFNFARRLRERGVDVWLDRWEMLPGDSLVDKIFDEGIREASAIVVVLSRNSVDKPWVKEELNTAVVKRINHGSKLIPVILDDCQVPSALTATVWEQIEDLENYEASLSRIIAAIFGQREKPELGMPPIYTTINDKGIPGLSRTDFLVLREFAQRVLERGDLRIIYTSEVWDATSRIGISKDDFRDSCTILCERSILKPSKALAPEPPYYSLTEHGLDHYLQGREPEFWEQFDKATYAIVNEGIGDNGALAARLGIDRLRARLILIVMEGRQYIRLKRAFGGHARIKEIRPTLRRRLQDT